MSMEIKYPLSLYKEKNIKRAIVDYRNICSIDIRNCEGYVVCCFSKGICDIDLIVKEFSNYLLELENAR